MLKGMMELRTCITVIFLFVTISACVLPRETLAMPADQFDESKISFEYVPESSSNIEADVLDAETFNDIILRILLSTRHQNDDRIGKSRDDSSSNQWGGSSSPVAPPQYHGFIRGLGRVDGVDTTSPNFDKRGRCRGNRCRGSAGLNPNASLRPLPFGKRSLTPDSANQSAENVSAKRGKMKGRQRPRTRVLSRKDFLPFGRR